MPMGGRLGDLPLKPVAIGSKLVAGCWMKFDFQLLVELLIDEKIRFGAAV